MTAQSRDIRRYLESVRDGFLAEKRPADYVNRLLVKDGVDPHAAHMLWWFSAEQRGSSADCFEETELEQPRVAIIGNAGAGKTETLKHMFCLRADAYLGDATQAVPVWLDLGKDLGPSRELGPALEHLAGGVWSLALRDSLQVCLILDGLDVAMAATPTGSHSLTAGIRAFLSEHADHLAQVFITCRRPAWASDWFEPDHPFLALSLDFLGDYEWQQKLPDEKRRRDFEARCAELGIASLRRNPFDGFYLADEYLAENPLPKNRIECFQQRVEKNLTYPTSGDTLRPPADRLRLLAQQLSCLATFCNRSQWTEQEACDLLGSAASSPRPLAPRADEISPLLAQPLFHRSGTHFSFAHELFREFLAAESLEQLPRDKQNQLLEAATSSGRICLQHRNTATLLAEMSPDYAKHLMDSDPIVALLTEIPATDDVNEEHLLQTVLDMAIAQQIAPGSLETPEGKSLRDALPHHQPADIAAFLTPYLDRDAGIALTWATECAVAWGGAPGLNELLCKLAHNGDLSSTVRAKAVQAVARTDDSDSLAVIYTLVEDPDEEVRVYALKAYREHDNPSPAQYIARLREGAHHENLLGILHMDTWQFAESLDEQRLREAFDAVVSSFRELGNLRPFVIRPLAKRAMRLQSHDIPPRLYLLHWGLGDPFHDLRDNGLDEILAADKRVFGAVFTACLEELADSDSHLDFGKAASRLAIAAGEDVFGLLPQDTDQLTEKQRGFVQAFVSGYFYRHRTSERLQLFQSRAPGFAQYLAVPAPPAPPVHDVKAERKRLRELLASAGDDPYTIMHSVAVAVCEAESRYRLDTEDIASFLSRLDDSLRNQVEQRLYAAANACEHHRKVLSYEPFQFTWPWWVGPIVRYLRERGFTFAPVKMAQVIAACGFCNREHDREYLGLLEELRAQDDALWHATVEQLLEDPISSIHSLVQYLIEQGQDFYAQRCAERLSNGWTTASHFHPLLSYLTRFPVDDAADTLCRCYELLRQYLPRNLSGAAHPKPSDERVFPDLANFKYEWQMEVLLRLLGRDAEFGWDELAERISHDEVPLRDLDYWGTRWWPQWPDHPERATVIADWYALVLRASPSDEHGGQIKIKSRLITALYEVGGPQRVIEELRRLLKNMPTAGPRVISYEIHQAKLDLLKCPQGTWQPKDLLRFIADTGLGTDTFGIEAAAPPNAEEASQAVEAAGVKRRPTRVQAVPPFTTPPGVTWENLLIEFWNDKVVKISVGQTTDHKTYADMGFSNRGKAAKPPDVLWTFLRELAGQEGELRWTDQSDVAKRDRGKAKKWVSDIRARLSAYFPGLTGDPFKPYRTEGSYQTRFVLKWSDDYRRSCR